MPKKQYKFNIFKVLEHITNGDYEWIETLSDGELKEVQPYVLQMWLKGANNNLDARLQMMNVTSNPYLFSLGNHKKLLYKLLCVANGFGISTRCTFKKSAKKTEPNRCLRLLSDTYDFGIMEARAALDVLSEEQLIEIAESNGYQSDEIKELKNEYGKHIQ